MQELIKIQKQNGKETVNARELHSFLESKQDFSTWIKNRIEKFGFEENQDFVRFHKKMEANNATTIEYFVSLEMAKELSMVENNEKGKQARRYFTGTHLDGYKHADLVLQVDIEKYTVEEKETTYRPCKNLEEFKPFFGKLAKAKDCKLYKEITTVDLDSPDNAYGCVGWFSYFELVEPINGSTVIGVREG